jgi:CRISPR-associated endonuclease Cas2
MSTRIVTTQVVDAILKSLIIGGMVSSAVIAPNALRLGDSALKHLDKRERKRELERVLSYMKSRKFISYHELPDRQIEVQLTDKGKKRARKVKFDELEISKPKRWDKKWRLVMFDIPEKRRKSRSALSMKLKTLGFYQLQKSAWAHPYPCSFEVELIKQVFEIRDHDIIFAEIDSIDHQFELLKHFRLHD